MEITLTNVDELNAVINLKINETDYTEKVEKSLREMRRKVQLNGFRTGMTPMGLVKKMYGKAVFADELNKLVSDNLVNYITENKLDILGEPLPSEENEKVDFDSIKEFDFKFDIGLNPAIEIKLSKKDKVVAYEIAPEEKEITEYKDYYRKRYGKFVDGTAIDDTSKLNFTFTPCDESGKAENATIFEGTDVHFYRFSVKTQEILKTLTLDSEFISASSEICTDQKDLLGIINVKENQLNPFPTHMNIKITAIQNLVPAELNQEFFDAAFGKDKVTDEESFHTKVIENIKSMNSEVTSQKIKRDIRAKLIKKIACELPDAFLKRWLKYQDEKKTTENIEEQYDSFQEDLKWHLIKRNIVKDNNIEVTKEDIEEGAKKQARAFFAQYGMQDVPDENLTGVTDTILKDEKQIEQLTEVILEDKIFDFLKETINLDYKQVSFEEFKNLKQD